MRPTLSPGVLTFCLCFGLLEALGATFYGIVAWVYLSGLELAHVWAFLIAGPFSALVAAMIIVSKPRRGAIWFIVGGALSGLLAVPYLRTDAHILPLGLVSLPMVLVGLWLLWASSRKDRVAEVAERPAGAGEQQRSSAVEETVFLGTVLFFVAFIGALWLFFVLDSANVTGLRGGPVPNYPMKHKNERLAFGVLLSLFGAGAGLVTFMRKRLRVRVEALVGMWLAMLFLVLRLSWFWGF